MDRGYFTFSSVKDPQKFLGFMRNGRPINYSNLKHDEKCRLIYKKEIYRDSSNDVTLTTSVASPIYQETSTTPSPPRKSSRMQKTHSSSNRIDAPKTSRANNRPRTHPVRHHHNDTLRNNNNNNNNNLSNVNLVKDRINDASNNDHDPYNNSVNISDNHPHHVRHHHGEVDGVPCDDTAANAVKGKNVKKNAKKCNNNRRNKSTVRHTRKKSSHKMSANRTPEN